MLTKFQVSIQEYRQRSLDRPIVIHVREAASTTAATICSCHSISSCVLTTGLPGFPSTDHTTAGEKVGERLWPQPRPLWPPRPPQQTTEDDDGAVLRGRLGRSSLKRTSYWHSFFSFQLCISHGKCCSSLTLKRPMLPKKKKGKKAYWKIVNCQ